MTHLTAPTRPLRRRFAGTGALLAIVALSLVGARPAAATNEFPPNPAATVVSMCSSEGAGAKVTMTNVGGADTAHFDVTVVGSDAISHYDVAPNGTDNLVYAFGEGGTATIHTTEANGFVQDDVVGPFNCTDYQGQIVLSCDGTQPILTGTYENKGAFNSALSLMAGDESVQAPTGPNQKPLILEVPDHKSFSAVLSTDVEGDFAKLEGTPNCDPPVTTSTTVTPATSTTTVPVSVISVNTPNPPNTLNPPVAQVTLARTGTTTWPLIGAGVTLIGLGIAFRRRAARLA